MTPIPLKRLRTGLTILGIITVVGVVGYMAAGWNILDAVYMVATVLSTVGLAEVRELDSWQLKVFTTLLMIFGVATVFYIVGGLLQMMFEGEINKAVGMRRATREIELLRDHVIICGFGRMGEILAEQLHRENKSFVIIDRDPERVDEALSLKYLALNDNSAEEGALVRARITLAKTLVTTLPDDADNVFITLTARNLNRDIMIIARGEFQTTEKKLMQAGADRVVLPAATGALRMATLITRPSTVELIEVVSGRQISEVEVDEVTIGESGPMVGLTVRESQIRTHYGLLIVAIRQPDGAIEFNPGPETVVQTGGSVIAMGRREDLDRLRAEHET